MLSPAAAAALAEANKSQWQRISGWALPAFSLIGVIITYLFVGDRLFASANPALHSRLWHGIIDLLTYRIAPLFGLCCGSRASTAITGIATGILKRLNDLIDDIRKHKHAAKTLHSSRGPPLPVDYDVVVSDDEDEGGGVTAAAVMANPLNASRRSGSVQGEASPPSSSIGSSSRVRMTPMTSRSEALVTAPRSKKLQPPLVVVSDELADSDQGSDAEEAVVATSTPSGNKRSPSTPAFKGGSKGVQRLLAAIPAPSATVAPVAHAQRNPLAATPPSSMPATDMWLSVEEAPDVSAQHLPYSAAFVAAAEAPAAPAAGSQRHPLAAVQQTPSAAGMPAADMQLLAEPAASVPRSPFPPFAASRKFYRRTDDTGDVWFEDAVTQETMWEADLPANAFVVVPPAGPAGHTT